MYSLVHKTYRMVVAMLVMAMRPCTRAFKVMGIVVLRLLIVVLVTMVVFMVMAVRLVMVTAIAVDIVTILTVPFSYRAIPDVDTRATGTFKQACSRNLRQGHVFWP